MPLRKDSYLSDESKGTFSSDRSLHVRVQLGQAGESYAGEDGTFQGAVTVLGSADPLTDDWSDRIVSQFDRQLAALRSQLRDHLDGIIEQAREIRPTPEPEPEPEPEFTPAVPVPADGPQVGDDDRPF